jgi:flagellar hook assembly protein FlgD
VYDLRGRQVQTLFEGSLPRGSHDFRWDGRDARGQRVAASSYFLRAIVAGRSFQQKVVLLR